MEYKIKIRGKKVKFAIKRVFSNIPYNESLIKLANKILKTARDKDIAEMCRSFLRRDAGGFYGHCRKIIENKLVEVMNTHPDLITSDNFEVNIEYSSEIRNGIAEYSSKLSSANKVYFRFNLMPFFKDFLLNGESSIATTTYHEFGHHLDRDFSRKSNILYSRIKNISKNNNRNLAAL